MPKLVQRAISHKELFLVGNATRLLDFVMGKRLQFDIHPKTLFEIAMALLMNSVSFPSKSWFSATFSILLRFGESWNPTNCEKFNADGSLMGRTKLDKFVW